LLPELRDMACESSRGERNRLVLQPRGLARNLRPRHRPTAHRRRRPKPDRRRALELLASCRDGCTEAIMLAHGFTIPLVELVRAGLATATAERVVAGGRTIEVARMRITEAGRQALASARI
jgi:hypothetical protein